MSQIVTFYSFKGGVGRSMALANIAVLLARRGLRVLAVDWDLEAPGLERYFDYFELSVKRGGLLPLLVEQNARLAADGEAYPERYRDHLWTIQVGATHPLWLLGSGRVAHTDYARTLESFSWSAFFTRGGGDFLERLRELWREDFDIVLIDSRTGISDAGGICTIQMPDVLVAMFTASYQSVLGVRDVVQAAQAARQRLGYDRMALTVLPLPGRFSPHGELRTAQGWLDQFVSEMGDCFRDWLPRWISPRQVFERLKIPHHDAFAFGERLAVVEQGVSDPTGLGYAYDRVTDLLATKFEDLDAALGPIARAPAGRPAAPPSTAPPADEIDVLVSYPRAGSVLREWTYRFTAALSQSVAAELERPLRIFVDIDERADAEFEAYRGSYLDRSRVLLAILTPHYFASSWCLGEWQAFEDRERAEQKTLIVPVALRGEPSFPARFRERDVLDGSSADLATSMDVTMQALVVAATKALSRAIRHAPAPPGTTRRISTPGSSAGVGAAKQRILFVAANPVGTDLHELTVEAREIEHELGRSTSRGQLEFTVEWGSRGTSDLRRSVMNTHPAIVHFSGHGVNDGLYLEGPDGLPQLLSPTELAQIFRAAQTPVKLVVLNACYAEKQAAAFLPYVDCVIGITASISDASARVFSASFYARLSAGASVAEAFDYGCAAIRGHALDGREGPQLMTRPGIDAASLFLAAPSSRGS